MLKIEGKDLYVWDLWLGFIDDIDNTDIYTRVQEQAFKDYFFVDYIRDAGKDNGK